MYAEQPGSNLALWAFLVAQSMYGDAQAAGIADATGQFADEEWDMLTLIRLLIQYRTSDDFDADSATETCKRIRKKLPQVIGHEREMANRILEMVDER
jgi:hypothetical protein